MKTISHRAIAAVEHGFDLLVGESAQILGLRTKRQPTARLALEQWLERMGHPPEVRGRVLITALRNYTWIEWAVYCACVMRRLGFASTLVFRGSQVRKLYGRPGRYNFWARVSAVPGIELIDLEATRTDQSLRDELLPLAKSISAMVIAYDRHLEEYDVATNAARFGPEMEKVAAGIAAEGAAFGTFLAERNFDRFFCYSGLIGESSVLLHLARRRGLPTVCLEGWAWRPGHMIYNFNGPALEYNIAGWQRAFGTWDEAKNHAVNSYLRFLDGDHPEDADWLKNFYRIQRAKRSDQIPSGLATFLQGKSPLFILAPNVIGDSSTLRRETIFSSQCGWIRETIAWFAARPELKLVIRAHPAEEWIGSKCVVKIGDVARAAAGGLSNVYVIGGSEPINTFSLVPFARAGLVWMSSAGAEFVVRGLPAMVAARPKYEGIGIAVEPPSRESYFCLLERWSRESEYPTPEQVLRARQYLYLIFKGFSFEAFGRGYNAATTRMDGMPNQQEHDRFYRILAGLEPSPDMA